MACPIQYVAVYSKSTEVAAPLSAVWEFHSRVEGLVALTPDWVGLQVERIVGPDDEAGDDLLTGGARVEASVRPFGLGERVHWSSVIQDRQERDGGAFYRDAMVDGPLPRWDHLHAFTALGPQTTLITDRVHYRLPVLGPFSGLGRVGLEPAFRYRHRRTRALLE